MAKSININDHVRMQLTEYGKQVLFQFWNNLNCDAAKLYSISEDNFIEMSVWDMMQVFGPVTSHGMPEMIFVDNLIEIKKCTF